MEHNVDVDLRVGDGQPVQSVGFDFGDELGHAQPLHELEREHEWAGQVPPHPSGSSRTGEPPPHFYHGVPLEHKIEFAECPGRKLRQQLRGGQRPQEVKCVHQPRKSLQVGGIGSQDRFDPPCVAP